MKLDDLMKRLNKFQKEKRIVINSNTNYVVNIIIMNTDDHSTTYGARVQGSITVMGNLESALNTINNLSENKAQPDLKLRLQDLQEVIKNLIPKLNPEEAEIVARDLRNLTDEVTSSRPRKSVFEVTAKGLLDAAKTVGSMAEPVSKAVKAVIDLFPGS